MVRVARFELTTPWSQTMCATKLRYTRTTGGEGGIRTRAPLYCDLTV